MDIEIIPGKFRKALLLGTREHKKPFECQLPILTGNTTLKQAIYTFTIYREYELEMTLPKTERFSAGIQLYTVF